MVTVWRLVSRAFAKTAFSGEGARKYGGRWNPKGISVVYLSEHLSLAALELLVHLDGPINHAFVAFPVTLDPSWMKSVDVASLGGDWRRFPASSATQAMGGEWVSSAASLALRVPSVIVPLEFNVLLNPAHFLFSSDLIGQGIDFNFDARLRG